MPKIETKKVSLPVEGMTCASCVARVEKTLKKVEGLSEVSVNFATESASFEVDSAKVTPEDIEKIIEEAGYKADASSMRKDKAETSKSAPAEKAGKYEKELFRDFMFALAVTLPVFILSMGSMWEGFRSIIPVAPMDLNKILMILTTPVIFIPGKRFYTIFWKNLKHFTADMNSLVAVGTGAAFAYSVFITLFPHIALAPGEEPHVYFDTAAVIITLILFGRWLESRAKHKTTKEIEKLLELQPDTAVVIRDGKEETIPLEELTAGDTVVIKPGNRIPADGVITTGYSAVDESMITGESIPVEKNEGSKVVGGTINTNGSLNYRVTAMGDNSVLGKIIRLVEEAQGSKAPIQNTADKIAAVFVPAVVGIAVVTFISWLVFGTVDPFRTGLINFVAVLIIACPCALGLATPTALTVASGLAAKHGILIKNGESLELARDITTIVLDKTGTITEGKPVVDKVIYTGSLREEALTLTASLEKSSEHVLSKAVVNYASEKNLELANADEFENIPGKGIKGKINGSPVAAGTAKLMEELSVEMNGKDDKSGDYSTVIYGAVNGKLELILLISDKIKAGSAKAVESFKDMGIKTVMLTGDNETAAKRTAEETGIDEYISGVMPGEKSDKLAEIQKRSGVTAMVGDGINDAPALAKADVGIAIGSGTDVAIETAQITLMRDDLNSVADAIKLLRKTVRTIRQNLFWAFIYNTAGIPLAALGLLNPMFAALAMSMSSVSVVSNSLRLRGFKFK